MPRSKILFLAVLLASALFAAAAGAQTPIPADWQESFRAHDENGDGVIDRAEFQHWMEDVFFHHDQGRKGYLTPADVRGVMSPATFQAANRKGDGKLTLSDFLRATFQDFAAIDRNGNGSITAEEIAAYVQRGRK
jgi:Ca2+-binding EF-hand superfamily protein